MESSDARKRLNDLEDQMTDAVVLAPWVQDDRRLEQLKSLCEAILAITGENEITFLCHNIDEPEPNSLSGQVVAFTDELLVRASLTWRNGGAVHVTASAVPRRLITDVEVISVDPQRAEPSSRSREWPNRLRIALQVQDSKVYLPIPHQVGPVPSESTDTGLLKLFREIVSKDLPSA